MRNNKKREKSLPKKKKKINSDTEKNVNVKNMDSSIAITVKTANYSMRKMEETRFYS